MTRSSDYRKRIAQRVGRQNLRRLPVQTPPGPRSPCGLCSHRMPEAKEDECQSPHRGSVQWQVLDSVEDRKNITLTFPLNCTVNRPDFRQATVHSASQRSERMTPAPCTKCLISFLERIPCRGIRKNTSERAGLATTEAQCALQLEVVSTVLEQV